MAIWIECQTWNPAHITDVVTTISSGQGRGQEQEQGQSCNGSDSGVDGGSGADRGHGHGRGIFVGATTDYDDGPTDEIGRSIAANFARNDITPVKHVRHSWGEALGDLKTDTYDIVFASDILIYSTQYPSLVASLLALFRNGTKEFVMCWDRPRCVDAAGFFEQMEAAGFSAARPRKSVWCFTRAA